MKTVYCITYTSINWLNSERSKHSALYSEEELSDFIARVKRVKEREYTDNEDIKVYKAELVEIDINKVLQPF